MEHYTKSVLTLRSHNSELRVNTLKFCVKMFLYSHAVYQHIGELSGEIRKKIPEWSRRVQSKIKEPSG